ncbi:hypothetical protein C2S51_036865 [Perilla frutescens var. frutescens]|nr:hypothetical protein C2S51_036865 [Perilla frutescens var. frutescens]
MERGKIGESKNAVACRKGGRQKNSDDGDGSSSNGFDGGWERLVDFGSPQRPPKQQCSSVFPHHPFVVSTLSRTANLVSLSTHFLSHQILKYQHPRISSTRTPSSLI